MMDQELKPCPFCGSPAAFNPWDTLEPPQWADPYCTNDECVIGFPGNIYGSKKEAVAAWNRRAEAWNKRADKP